VKVDTTNSRQAFLPVSQQNFGGGRGGSYAGRVAAITLITMVVTRLHLAATPIPVTTLRAMWEFIPHLDGGGERDSMAIGGTDRVVSGGSNSQYGTQKGGDAGVPEDREARLFLVQT